MFDTRFMCLKFYVISTVCFFFLFHDVNSAHPISIKKIKLSDKASTFPPHIYMIPDVPSLVRAGNNPEDDRLSQETDFFEKQNQNIGRCYSSKHFSGTHHKIKLRKNKRQENQKKQLPPLLALIMPRRSFN